LWQRHSRGILNNMKSYWSIIVILCLLSGCTRPSDLSLSKRGQALVFYNQGKKTTAIKYLEQAENIKTNPRNNYWLGQIYFEEANYPKAIKHLEKCDSHDYRLAYAYYKNSEKSQSIEICRKVISQGCLATTPQNWQKIIDLTQQLNQIDLLITAKKQELLISPKNSLIYAQLARLYNKNNQPDMAIASALRSINLYPNENSAYNAIAKAYASQKEYDLAIASLTTYIKNTSQSRKE
jgi:tetratricopeptide (TPR) repeat protein